MKANYLSRNKPRSAHFKKIAILCTILVLGAGIFVLFGPALVSLASPLWKAENSLLGSMSQSLGFLSSKASLVEENNNLKERINSLETELSLLRAEMTAGENAAAALAAARPQGDSMKLAAVLTRPPQTPYDVLVIDIGKNGGIAGGALVYLPEGPVIGEVREVLARSSQVRLFTAVDEETSAVLERNSIPITLVGVGAGNFRARVPRDVEVEVGDKILSPDLNARLVAVVGVVESEPTESFKEILAYSPTNIFSLRFVYVMP